MGRDNSKAKEDTPLLLSPVETPEYSVQGKDTLRYRVFEFLEAKTKNGKVYENVTIFLIFLNIAVFIFGTLFIEEYNPDGKKCGKICDALWFGNDETNALSFLNIGPTSMVELITVFVFSVDYLGQPWTCDFLDDKYAGFC